MNFTHKSVLSKQGKPKKNSYSDDKPHSSRAQNLAKSKKAAEEKAKEAKKIKIGEIDSTKMKKSFFYFATTFIICAFVLVLAYSFYGITNYAMNHPYFEIKEVSVDGIDHFSKEDIIQISGIDESSTLFSIYLDEVEYRLLQNPWIEDVEIQRQLPDTLKISIKERRPRFTVLHNNKLYYVDAHGKVISQMQPNNFISLPMLELGQSPEDALRVLPEFIQEVEYNNEFLPFDFDKISWLRVSTAKGIEMFWEDNQILLSFDTSNWKKNIELLNYAIDDLKEKKEFTKVEQIHSGNNQVWFINK